MKPPIPKRIVVKLGNVYCAEIDGKFKAYFQYIADDVYQLNSRVIRIFKNRWRLDENPSLENIVNDESIYYMHTYGISSGVKEGLWYKVGNCKNYESVNFSSIIFANTSIYPDILGQPKINPQYNWRIWHLGDETSTFIGQLPKELWYNVFPGGVLPSISIIEVIRYGFLPSFWDHNQFKRYPRSDAELFMKKLNDDGSLTYYHFLGEEALQQIEVRNGHVILLDRSHRDEGNSHLVTQPFSDFEWRYWHYIPKEEFIAAWDKQQFVYPEAIKP